MRTIGAPRGLLLCMAGALSLVAWLVTDAFAAKTPARDRPVLQESATARGPTTPRGRASKRLVDRLYPENREFHLRSGERVSYPWQCYGGEALVYQGTMARAGVRRELAGTGYQPVLARKRDGSMHALGSWYVMDYREANVGPYYEGVVAIAVTKDSGRPRVLKWHGPETAAVPWLYKDSRAYLGDLLLNEQLPIDWGNELVHLNKRPGDIKYGLDAQGWKFSFEPKSKTQVPGPSADSGRDFHVRGEYRPNGLSQWRSNFAMAGTLLANQGVMTGVARLAAQLWKQMSHQPEVVHGVTRDKFDSLMGELTGALWMYPKLQRVRPGELNFGDAWLGRKLAQQLKFVPEVVARGRIHAGALYEGPPSQNFPAR